MAYELTKAEKRYGAIPGQIPSAVPTPMPSTEELTRNTEALMSGRPSQSNTYESSFGPEGLVSTAPGYTGKPNVPQQYYGSSEDIMQSDVIRNTDRDPYATQRAVQHARLQDGRALNLEYGDDRFGKSKVTATSSIPSGKANVFSGYSEPMTPAQQAAENARVAEGQRVAAMYKREADGLSREDAAQPSGPRYTIVGGSPTLMDMANQAIARRSNRLATEESGRNTRAQMQESGAAQRSAEDVGMRREHLGATQALEREKLAAEGPYKTAMAKLYESQAEAGQYGVEDLAQMSEARRILANPNKYADPKIQARAKAYVDKVLNDKIVLEQAKQKAKVDAMMGYAEGGIVRLKDGEGVGEQMQEQTQTYLNPKGAGAAVMGALSRGYHGVMDPISDKISDVFAPKFKETVQAITPDPTRDMWRLSPTEEAALPKFAAGGAVNSGMRPSFGTDMIGDSQPEVHPVVAQYGQYLTEASKAGIPAIPFPKYIHLMQSGKSAANKTPAAFADGGDVSELGRPLRGPGTGTSDSIPAMIDGHQPAALSKDEYVIPAHVVRAKGTEFFDKLLAQYADKGESDAD